ncbi:ABC transporter permease EcsB [Staphylococcus rostri]|uniref:Multidrug ABC transporter ATP-binding protein n=1 Tax=Staphylococcus rostri TaxID=522262 RepID=A0A2K3YG63_9STAP|nr:ABC transporter permease [Staphylococcus rostri]PNZ24569.1 multidrug ABC transporter ATP-binding protein [Staphylococcus rostri]
MMTARQLFTNRYRAKSKEKQYYNKFIFNGHFTVFLVILIGAFILGYGEWLRNIPRGIDYFLLISIVLAVSANFPLKTYLEEADSLFLLPYEAQMNTYIQQSIWMSYFTRLPLQVLLLAIAYPLVRTIAANEQMAFVIVAVFSLIFPLLGLLIKWHWFVYGLESWSVHLVLFVINLSGYYVMLSTQSLHSFGSIISLVVLYIFLRKLTEQHRLPWAFLIKQARQHQVNYYKYVSMFTDVKGLQEGAVRRRYLDFLLATPKSFNEEVMYPYLFKRNFIRGKDAFNLTLRLVLIAALLMIWLSQPFISLIIGCMAMYILILQMSQFYTQEAYGLWPQVWPASEDLVIQGYQKFLNVTAIVISTLFSIIYLVLNLAHGYLIILFFAVGFITIRRTIKKLKYKEALLRD